MISQGNAFMQYIEKNKNKYNNKEGFRQRKIETPVYDASQKVYGDSNTQSNSELLQSQNDTLANYSNAFDKDTGKTQDYLKRISPSNPYLNKFVHFTNGTIAYVTNLGVAKPIGAWETYQSLLGNNGCPADAVNVSIDWSPSYIEGSIIPLNPTLVVGPQMTAGESCGNEGKNVYVSSLVSKDATAAYQGCYQDSSPSIMTFIGDVPPVQIDASIQNGDFSQPVIANNTVKYTTNDINFSKIPGWEFGAILNNGDGWTTLPKPFPFGAQCALLQYVGYITQSVNFSVGTYNLEFASTGRQTSWNTESNSISIIIDKDTNNSLTISTFQPPLGNWEMYSVPFTISTPGMHTITFQGQGNVKDTSGGYDVSSALQGIRISSSGTAPSGAGNYTYDQCKTAAIDGAYTYFGLQYGNPTTGKGYCAVTNDFVSATKNGTSYAISAAVPLWASNTNTGSVATLSMQGSLSVLNSQGVATFSTPGASDTGANAPSSYIGCYGDTGNRALPNFLASQNETVTTCRQHAIDGGYSYFGLQYVNPNYLECWAGSDLQQAKKYGIATNCTKQNDGTMAGGGWSNAVYSVNPPSDYFLILQDDANLCIYKGTGPTDNQGGIWYSMTNGQQQKPNPAFAASKGKYGKNYITTGDTLAAGDFVGSNDGSIYLIMQSDGNLVLYTSQSAENCSKSTDGSSSMGGQGATALYKMSEVGIPSNLGKIGYVDKNSEIYMYPDNKIGLSNNYVKYTDSVSYGSDIPGALNSGGSLDQCKNTCNSLSECYGFEYHSSGNVCYPKDNTMYPTGPKQSMDAGSGIDLYVREKMVKEGFETAEIDTNKWKNYSNNNNVFDDSIVDSVSKQLTDADKKELSDLSNKITSFSQEIQRNNAEYKQNLSDVNARTVESSAYMKDSQNKYNKLQSKIKHSGRNLLNMENIVSDTNILVVQQNTHYIMYAMIAIILLIIAIKFLS